VEVATGLRLVATAFWTGHAHPR